METQAKLKNVKIISIEGNIGSGKSTLLKTLKKYCDGLLDDRETNYYFIAEPVDVWNTITDENNEGILEKFYNEPTRYAFSFQMMAYITRFNRIYNSFKFVSNEAKLNPNKNYIIFTERCLYTDKYVFAKMLHNDKSMETIEFNIYNHWFDTFANWIPIHKILYVKAIPEKCKERVQERNRNGEENISLDYLSSCHNYQEDMIKTLEHIPNFTLDGNDNIYDQEIWHAWKEQIFEFVKQ